MIEVFRSLFGLIRKLDSIPEVCVIDVDGKVRLRLRSVDRRLSASEVSEVVRIIEDFGGKIITMCNKNGFVVIFDLEV